MSPQTRRSVASSDIMLSIEQGVVVFDGFKALDIDTFTVRDREVRVVIGPNGAGKTTLCDVISGKTRLTSGRCFFDGTDISQMKAYEIARRGVGRKFQTPAVFDGLSVRENLGLAARKTTPREIAQWVQRSAASVHEQVDNVARTVGLAALIDKEARYLSHGQRQLLEIGMLLVARPKLLLIDEPAAGLTDSETEAMARLLIELAGHHTVIVIEHDMDFVRELHADVTVLHEGRVLAEGPMHVVQGDPRVIEVYLGR